MKLKAIASCMVMLLIIPMCVFSESIGISAQTDSAGKEVTVTGNLGEKNTVITYSVLPEGVTPSSLTVKSVNTNKYILGSCMSDINGDIEFCFMLPDSADGGTYTVYVCGRENESTTEFSYINELTVAKLCEKVNECGSSEEIKTLLDSDYSVLGLKETVYTQISKRLTNDLYEKKKAVGDFTAATLKSSVNKLAAIYEMSDSESIEKSFEKNAPLFGLDYKSDFGVLNKQIQNKFKMLIALPIEPNAAYESTVVRRLADARVAEGETYSFLKETVMKYPDIFKLDMSEYNKLNEYYQDSVFQSVFKNSPSSVEDVCMLFNSCVKEQLLASEKKEPIRGGSAGGSITPNTKVAIDSEGSVIMNKTPFLDIANHWGREYIEKMYKNGIVSGYENNLFKPDQNVTRAEFAMLIYKAFNLESKDSALFSDVNSEDWFYNAVSSCAYYGIVKGNDGCFKPNDMITRQDAAAMLYRLSRLSDVGSEIVFTDAAKISPYAAEAVGALSQAGIIRGDGNGQFNPLSSTTRAEAVTFISRMCDFLSGR